MELLFWCPSEESQTVYKRPLIHQLVRRAGFTVFAKYFKDFCGKSVLFNILAAPVLGDGRKLTAKS